MTEKRKCGKSLAKNRGVWYTCAMVDWKGYENKKICVAVSGGGDSVALLHYLKTAQKTHGYLLSAVHCEHGIRGEESLADMRFTQALCASWDIPLRIFQGDCKKKANEEKVSLETAARRFRYACFEELLGIGEADYIATAHHQDDEAETVLFRLARGSGLSGAAAMRAENGRYLRPFLHRSKTEILQYLEENGLSFCEDSTNLETDATRNKLRLTVLPLLEEAVPGAAGNLARFASLAAEDDALLQRLSAPLLEEGAEPLVRFSPEKPLFTRACLMAMKGVGLCKDYTATHLQALFDLQSLERGAVITLPQGVRVKREEKGVRFYLQQEEKTASLAAEKPLNENGYDGGRCAVNIAFAPPAEGNGYAILRADWEKIPARACFRFRREGDFIQSFGGGKKSLKKFFNEKKIPVEERGSLPLIAMGDGEVFAVCGVEISQKIAVDEKTKRVVYITVRRKES